MHRTLIKKPTRLYSKNGRKSLIRIGAIIAPLSNLIEETKSTWQKNLIRPTQTKKEGFI